MPWEPDVEDEKDGPWVRAKSGAYVPELSTAEQLREVADLGIVAHQDMPVHGSLARCWIAPPGPAVGRTSSVSGPFRSSNDLHVRRSPPGGRLRG
jgi:hypothetical protein